MVDAHVDMMRALRAESKSEPWYGRVFRDYDNKPFQLHVKRYDIEQLRVKGVSVHDFLLLGASWDHLYGMGYRISDMKQLGGTLDDVRAMGARVEHLTDEFEHVTSDFVTELLQNKFDLLQWSPAELFKMGFTMDALMDLGCNSEMIPLAEMQYFFSPTKLQAMRWVAKAPPRDMPVGKVVGSGMFDGRRAKRIQIDVSRLT